MIAQEYSKDWVTNKLPLWEKYLAKFKNRSIQYMEIGCFEGRATRWVLDNFNVHKAFVYDLFTIPTILDRFKNNISPYISKVHINIGKSQHQLRALPPELELDVIYIDGSHMAYDTLEDAILSFRHLSVGGIMIFDDYKWKTKKGLPKQHTPKLGIDTFIEVFKDFIQVHHVGWQVVIERIK